MILVIKDDDFDEGFVEALKDYEYYRVSPNSYHEELAGKNCVIVDHSLPGGCDLAMKVKESCKIPVIVVTSDSNKTIAEKLLKAGIDDYVLKDKSFVETLRISIKSAIDKYKKIVNFNKAINILSSDLEKVKMMANDLIFAQR